MDPYLQKIGQKYTKAELQRNLLSVYLKRCHRTIMRDILLSTCLIIAILLYIYCERFNESLWIVFRLILVHIVHPYICNVAKLPDTSCLIENRDYQPMKYECTKLGSAIGEILHVSHQAISPLQFEQWNLHEKRVIKIAHPPMHHWPIRNYTGSISNLRDLYATDHRLSPSIGCELISNLVSSEVSDRWLSIVIDSIGTGIGWDIYGRRFCGDIGGQKLLWG